MKFACYANFTEGILHFLILSLDNSRLDIGVFHCSKRKTFLAKYCRQKQCFLNVVVAVALNNVVAA